MIVPVTFTGSVVVVACFLSPELGWANASGAISEQPSITISFFIVRLLLLMVVLSRQSLDVTSIQQEPLHAFPTAHFRALVGLSRRSTCYRELRSQSVTCYSI